MEHEQLLLLSYSTVISLLGFLDELLVFCELLAIRERNTVESLKSVVLGICQEVGRRVLQRAVSDAKATSRDGLEAHFGDGHGLDSSGMRYVGTSTEIDQRSTSVHGRRGTVGHLVLDVVLLVFVVLRGMSSVSYMQQQGSQRTFPTEPPWEAQDARMAASP